MSIKQKKSQVTIFLILGVVIVIVVVILIFINTYVIKKTAEQEAKSAKKITSDIQPIKNYVEECLSIVSKDGLKTIGKQGGYLFTSQGGSFNDYPPNYEGFTFVNYENSRVVYNIIEQGFPIGRSTPTIPDYPWEYFPYTDSSLAEQEFIAPSAFGRNVMLPLYSLEKQLVTFVNNNIDSCLDFSVFEEQGFKISAKEKSIATNINENDVVFSMTYPIIVEKSISGEKTEIKDFSIKHTVRLGKLHKFVDALIDSDINDISFDILTGSKDNFAVSIEREVFNKDDLIIITDSESMLDGQTYKYFFARRNRNPALHYLPDLTVDPSQFKAYDPDEDVFNINSFTQIPGMVSVTDGELEDYQS